MGTAPQLTPEIEYERRRAARLARAVELEGRERQAGRLRIALFLLMVTLLFVVPLGTLWAILWFAPVVIVLVVAVNWHRRVVWALARERRAIAYFERCLQRVNDRWIGQGPSGAEYIDAAHPYSGDLDIFGRGSLYQYVCEAVTPVGRDVLASWLSAAANRTTIQARQIAVAELRDQLDLRESLGTLSHSDSADRKTRALHTWPVAPAQLTSRAAQVAAAVLGFLGLGGVFAWIGGAGPSPLLLIVMVEVVFIVCQWGRIRAVMHDARPMLAELQEFLPVLRCLEKQTPASPLLRSIRAALLSEGEMPSRRVAQLATLLDRWDSCLRNQMVLPVAVVIMLPLHLVYAVERWRLRDGRYVRGWLDAVGAFEALCSFSALAYEHGNYPFADVSAPGPELDAASLGHPLLPSTRRVTNDVRLGAEPALMLVSGSNMSGKSTLMRAVGVNVVLALAGAPVCARRMLLSPMSITTAMRQADSLHDGVSAFYAEIRRLQAIREWTAGSLPVLFLLDEILRGTNSHDRRIGAEAVIRALLSRGAIGMVSTHDLALAEIVDRLGTTASNVHFEDQFEDGKVTFDYRLRPGVVPRGNGLVLMRLLGFDV